MTKKIIGYFEEANGAEEAVKELRSRGFEQNHISILGRDENRGNREHGKREEIHEHEIDYQGGQYERYMVGTENESYGDQDYHGHDEGESYRSQESYDNNYNSDYLNGGKTGGAFNLARGTGTLAGAGLGTLAGFALGAGALTIPGIGPLLAVGPIASALIGASAGGIAGALNDFGFSGERSHYYEEKVKEGKIIVVMETDEEKVEKAAEILRAEGAREVETNELA